jgi:hypothetical protein
MNEQTLLSDVRAHDADHKEKSSLRPQAERLSKFLGFLNQFMGGVAIGIQASPEISSLVVGAFRIVIDLALKFAMFFTKLADMVCIFQEYLAPLAEYAKSADIELVGNTVVSAYASMLEFGWKARRVFVNDSGSQRRWTSLTAFMRQQWEPFDLEFKSITENLQHHLDVLSHSITAMGFDITRRTEESRRIEEESEALVPMLSTQKR